MYVGLRWGENRQRDDLKWPSTSWDCKEVAWSDRRSHESGPEWSSMRNVNGLLILFEHRRGHHGAAQVANVPTWIVQSANVDHTGSDVKMRSGLIGSVSFTVGKLMIQWFQHDVCNEIAVQGIGAHKSGPKWSECEMWTDYYYFLNTRAAHKVDFGAK